MLLPSVGPAGSRARRSSPPLAPSHLQVLLHLLVQPVQLTRPALQQDAGHAVPPAPLVVLRLAQLLAGQA